MKLNKYLIIMLAGLAMIGITSGQAVASGYDHGDNFCSQTAKTVFKACRYDVKDDFNETLANCINIEDEDDRALCNDEAKQAKKEDGESCKEQKEARFDVCDLIGEVRYADPLKDPGIAFVDPDDIGDGIDPNPYVNMTVGHTYVLRAGEDFEETVIVYVTDEVREAEGTDEDEPVKCRVVADVGMVYEEDEPGIYEWVVDEYTDDYFAQDEDAIVYYCGEISRNFEDGYLDNLDGSFFSGVEFAKAGVLMRNDIGGGEVDRQEYAIAEAEDLVEYLDDSAYPADENLLYPCPVGGCRMTHDSSALEPESTEFKYYIAGTGFVLAVALEDGEITGEREELVCDGSSLDILTTSCGFAEDQAEKLVEKLCEVAPQVFCPEEDSDD